ncbi:MAG: hypothetical protein KAR06_11620, partial [Deltaproteobacteria bacterium]|nr:hypothetical protein [Deltaproteobacteria bacterium]
MRPKISLSVFILCVSLVLLVFACDKAPVIEGVYTSVPDKQYNFDGNSVEVVEFLSFYCGTCYGFERSIPVIRGNFPKKIKWKIVPIYWG